MASSRTNTSKPYQGYPYVNPMVIDVPTIDAATAAKWANLPRRPIRPVKTDLDGGLSRSDVASGNAQVNTGGPSRIKGDQWSRKKDEDRPVVYIQMPEDASSGESSQSDRRDDSVNNNQINTEESPRLQSVPAQKKDTVYTSLPEESDNNSIPSQHDRGLDNPAFKEVDLNVPPRQLPREKPQKEDDIPVVYIPLPDETTSVNSSVTMPQDREGQQPDFVEETIFYDPFENRQIDMARPKEPSEAEEGSRPGPSRPAPVVPSPLSPGTPDSFKPSRPPPPSSLNLYSPGSGYMPPTSPASTQAYGNPCMDDGFSLTPLPVTDYSRPPPAYSEIDNPPRTQVVVVTRPDQSPTVGLPSSNRKLVQCQQCGLRVHTLVTRENGALTHFVAFLTVCLCMFPLTALVYCTNVLKYQVHYCPNCNYKVGHDVPLFKTDLIRV